MINTLCTFLFILLSFKYNFWEPAKAKKLLHISFKLTLLWNTVIHLMENIISHTLYLFPMLNKTLNAHIFFYLYQSTQRSNHIAIAYPPFSTIDRAILQHWQQSCPCESLSNHHNLLKSKRLNLCLSNIEFLSICSIL